MNIESLLNYAVTEFIAHNHIAPEPNMSPMLVVNFRRPVMMDRFKSLISPLVPDLLCHGKALVSSYPTIGKAKRAELEIRRVLQIYDEAVIMQPFESNWLDHYLNVQQFGIEGFRVVKTLSSPDGISEVMKTLQNEYASGCHSENGIHAAKEQVLLYTDSDMAKAISLFINAHWQGHDSLDGLNHVIMAVINQIKQHTQGLYFFDGIPSEHIMNAIFDKAEALIDIHMHKAIPFYGTPVLNLAKSSTKGNTICADKNILTKVPDSQPSDLTLLKKRFTELVNTSITRDSCKGLHVEIQTRIFSTYTDLRPKYGLFDREQFTGLDLSFDYKSNLVLRLTQECMSIDYQMALARAITDYVIKVMQLRQITKFEQLLIEHSRVMNVKPLQDHLMNIAGISRPNV